VTNPETRRARSGECTKLDAVPPRLTSSRFVGRRAELARLEAIWKAAVNDEVARTVLVSGEAGVGKTRLVSELCSRVGNPALILHGQCTELVDRALPFGPIIPVLRKLHSELDAPTLEAVVGPASEELAALVPDLHARRSNEPALTAALFEQLLGVFERLGDRLPTLVVIEDLHWADQSTRDLLVFLARSLHNARVVVLGTYRSDDLHRRHPLRPAVAELERSDAAERIDLKRFDRDEAGELIAAIRGDDPPSALVDRTYERSDGNAFFVEELLSVAPAPGQPLPVSLRDILLARVDALDDNTQHVLRCAAIIGRSHDHRLLAALADLPEPALLDALRNAAEHQILVSDGIEYRFRHALVHEAIYDDLIPGDRVALHGRVAELLREHPQWFDGTTSQLVSELACHWDAAHDAPRALTASFDAAKAAERMYAYAESFAHAERVLTYWSQVPDAEERVGLRHVDVLRYTAAQAEMAGSHDRALDFIRGARREVDVDADPVTAGLLHERWARYLWMLSQQRDEILRHCDESLRLVPDAPTPERARVLATWCQQLMLAGSENALAACEEAIRVAQEAGERVIEGHARNSYGSALAAVGNVDEGLEQLQQARVIAHETHSWVDAARADVNEGGALTAIARNNEALDIFDRGIEEAYAHGLRRAFGTFLQLNASEALWALGRWNEVDERLREVEAVGPIGLDAVRYNEQRALLAGARGEFDDARAYAARMNELLAPEVDSADYVATRRLDAWIRTRERDAAAAVEIGLEVVRSPAVDHRICSDNSVAMVLDVLEPAADLGLTDAARELAAQVDEWVEGRRWGGGTPGGLDASRAHAEAEVARSRGNDDGEQWTAVAELWANYTMDAREAYARWRAADALARADDRVGAADAARRAYELAGLITWPDLRDRVASLVRRARLDVDLGEDEPQSPAERLGLTERELDVLALVAEGRTNRQIAEELFISAKTASVHVSNILAKLDVSNRGEAGAAARRLGLDHSRASA
jgi:DNA-binding CsgD family transcriptional regulator